MRRCLLLIASATILLGSNLGAQSPPPGAIFDLAVSHPAELSAYEFFQLSFTASFASTAVSFAFREDPDWFQFDAASVTTGVGPNLLVDPGFESATLFQNLPTGWGRWRQPGVDPQGALVSQGNFGCPGTAQSGSKFWCEAVVSGYDGLYQIVPTTIGVTYTIGWWLADNSGGPPSNPTDDMLVYTTNGLPEGTVLIGAPPIVTPEPATMTLFATGLVGLVAAGRRRRKA